MDVRRLSNRVMAVVFVSEEDLLRLISPQSSMSLKEENVYALKD